MPGTVTLHRVLATGPEKVYRVTVTLKAVSVPAETGPTRGAGNHRMILQQHAPPP